MRTGIDTATLSSPSAERVSEEHWDERALHRPRLDLPPEVLGGRRQIVEVVAPAGYGKSTLLESWSRSLAAGGRAVHRLLLSGSHRDPVRFVGDLLAVVTGIGDSGDKKPVYTEAIGLDQLMTALRSDEGHKVIVIDDVHLLESSAAIATLNWLCDNQPDQVLIILGAREYTGLMLQKRLLRKQLTRFDARKLAFTLDESRTFLSQLSGLELEASVLSKLHAQTEGWAAALQMAALAMGNRKDLAGFVENFTGSNREITDYLAEAVLSNLNQDDVDFLFRISVLDRISADICRALTGDKTPQLRLEAIERQNLFLLPLSDKRDWYRFHALFGEFLRDRFRAHDPDAWLDSLKRAESWSIQHDFRDDAINYALRGGLQERAAQILSIYAEELVMWRGEHRTLLSWIEQLSPRVLARYPQIQVSLVWALNFDLRFDEARNTLDALVAEVKATDQPDLYKWVRSYQGVCEVVRHALADDAERCLELAPAWLEQNPDAGDFQIGSVCVTLVFGLKTNGDFEGALAMAQKGKQHFARARSPYGTLWTDVVDVVTLIRQGHLRRALNHAEAALRFTQEKLGSASHGSSVMLALIAGLQYEANNLPAAREALSSGLQFLAQHSSIDPILVGYVTLARLLASEGRYADAKDVLIDGETLGAKRDAPRLVVYSMMWRGTILLREGDVGGAEELLRHPALDGTLYGGRHSGLVQSRAHQLQMRIAIARGNADEALALLQPMVRRARQQGQLLTLVELLVQRVQALYLSGDENDALRTLSEALGVAAPEGMVRAFVDEATALQPLLLVLQQRGAAAELETATQAHLQTVLEAMQLRGDGDAFGKRSDHGTVLEPLTKRELQILRMIDGGLSNRQLAQSLFVSEGTIKWHLHNLYNKLSVRSRSGAIAKARRLTLIR